MTKEIKTFLEKRKDELFKEYKEIAARLNSVQESLRAVEMELVKKEGAYLEMENLLKEQK